MNNLEFIQNEIERDIKYYTDLKNMYSKNLKRYESSIFNKKKSIDNTKKLILDYNLRLIDLYDRLHELELNK